MKKEILLSLLAITLVASPAVTWAESATGTAPGYRLGKPFKEAREEYREKVKDFKASTTAARQEKWDDLKKATSSAERKIIRHDWIKLQMERLTERLEAAIGRSEKFIERLTALLDKKEDEGKDVTAAKAKLEAAKTEVSDAEEAVGKITTALDNALASSTITRESFAPVRTVVNEAVKAVKEAHQAIVDVLRALKN